MDNLLPSSLGARRGTVEITSLAVSDELQCRSKLDEVAVNDYAAAMARGEEFPPLTVAVVGGRAFVVDGYHRLAAAKSSGERRILIEAREMTWAEALEAAARVNRNHGVRLKPKEVKRANELLVAAFIKQGKHLVKSRWSTRAAVAKSLREIEKDLGDVMSFSTIRRILQKNHRSLYWKLWGDSEQPTGIPERDLEVESTGGIFELLKMLENCTNGITDQEARGLIIQRASECIERIKSDKPFAMPPEIEDF